MTTFSLDRDARTDVPRRASDTASDIRLTVAARHENLAMIDALAAGVTIERGKRGGTSVAMQFVRPREAAA